MNPVVSFYGNTAFAAPATTTAPASGRWTIADPQPDDSQPDDPRHDDSRHDSQNSDSHHSALGQPRTPRFVLVAGADSVAPPVQPARAVPSHPEMAQTARMAQPAAATPRGIGGVSAPEVNPPFSNLVRGFDDPGAPLLLPQPSIVEAPQRVVSVGGVARMTAFLVREEGWYRARAVEVDVTVTGKTVEQALAYLREALEAHFETHPVPDCVYDGAIIAPVPVHIRR